MKNRVALWLAAAMVVLMTAAFFSPALKQAYGNRVNTGLQVFGAFAVIPAVVGLLRLHLGRVWRGTGAAFYSAVVVVAFAVTLVVGLGDGNLRGPRIGWILSYIFDPLQRVVFAFLAFFIASAAYRAFRARTLEATLLLLAAFVVMVGNAIFPLPGPDMPLDLWLLSVPALAMQRGVVLGVALGIIAQSVRILLGLERGFVGRG
jgi:hypothetical protein